MRLAAIPLKQVADMPTVSASLWQLILHMPPRAELRPAPMPRLPRSCGLKHAHEASRPDDGLR